MTISADEQAFGKNRYVWCSVHKRVHSTGWCCAERHGAEKILMESQTASAAADEAKYIHKLDTTYQ